MVSDIDSSAYSGGSNPPIVVNAPPPPTTAHAASESTGTGSGRCASLFQATPPNPRPPTRAPQKRTTAPSGSARRLRVLNPGSVARGAHSLQPGSCSESSLRQCSHAHSGNRTGAFTARAQRFNRWGTTHHSKKSTMHAYQHNDTPRCAPQSDSEMRRIH